MSDKGTAVSSRADSTHICNEFAVKSLWLSNVVVSLSCYSPVNLLQQTLALCVNTQLPLSTFQLGCMTPYLPIYVSQKPSSEYD